MKKYDDDKKYDIAFKSEDHREAAWTHIHCIMIAGSRMQHSGDDLSYIDYLKHRMRVAYQLMTLYDDTLYRGQAFGAVLNYVQILDEKMLRYLNITEKKGA